MGELNGKEEKELTELEAWEIERKLMELAFENSYQVLTNQISFEELMSYNHKKGKSAILAHDPHEGVTSIEYSAILGYFEEREEYEKCAELQTCQAGVKN